MEFEQYKIDFKREASKIGYSAQNIDYCLKYAEKLLNNNVPVIYNTTHLSALVGYNKNYIKRAVTFTPYFYRDFEILKKNGKKRAISEPLPSLKEIQLWILKNILYQIKVSPFAKAYRPNVRIIENLKFHKNQRKVFNLDIRDFFPSITQEKIENIFLKLGYSQLLSNLLSKLCCRNGCLPQGAPTSPCLSNIYMLELDVLISKYCLEKSIRYTRYADDLTFSGDFDEDELFAFVTGVITSFELQINSSKSRLMLPNERQTVTGIVVNEKPQVIFHKRNKLRQEIYYIKKFGLIAHMEYKKITKAHYLEHLLGKVNFVLQINPADSEFKEYKDFLVSIKRNQL